MIKGEIDWSLNPGDVAREIRLSSHRFVLSLWSARKKYLYPDQAANAASGANDPLRGSASLLRHLSLALSLTRTLSV